jgi:hypothetical protein
MDCWLKINFFFLTNSYKGGFIILIWDGATFRRIGIRSEDMLSGVQ